MDSTVVRRRRGIGPGAVAASAALHALLLFLALATATGASVSSGRTYDDNGDAVEISLAGLRSDAKAQTQAHDASPLDRMLANSRAAPSDAATATPLQTQPSSRALDALFAEASKASAPTGGGAPAAGQSNQDLGGRGRAPNGLADLFKDRKGADSNAQRRGADGDEGDAGLWAQVEPCWRRMRQGAPPEVTVVVLFAPSGRIAAPPRIIRSQGAPPDRRQLQAETTALQALDACQPYRDIASLSPSGAFKLDFVAGQKKR